MRNAPLFACAVLVAFLSVFVKWLALPGLLLFLLVVPGYGLLKLFNVKMKPLQFAVACAVLSYLIATHAVYWVSRGIGYGDASIALAFSLCAVPLLFSGISWKWKGTEISAEIPALVGAAAVFAIVFAIASLTIWQETAAGIVNGGWNWSDFGYHLSIITTINNGNFLPQAPFFAGAQFDYHWFADFLTAIESKASGIFPAYLARVEVALFAMLSFAACYLLAEKFSGKRSTALICAFLVLFGGGLGWLKLVELGGTAPVTQLIANNSFDNSWAQDWGPYRIPSVFGTTVMTWRASAAGFPAFLVCLLFLFDAFGKKAIGRNELLLAGLIAGLVAPFSFFTFIACVVSFVVFAAFWVVEKGKQSIGSLPNLALFLLPLVFALPFVLQMLFSGAGAGTFKLNFGWEAPKDIAGFAWFYIANLGIPLLAFVPGIAFGKLERKWVLAGLAVAFFAIPNIFSVTRIEWDMCKMFAFLWVPLCIGAGTLFEKLPKIVWGVAIAACAISPLLVALWMISGGWLAYSWDQVAAAEWIGANTGNDAIFATAAMINQPTDIAGRLRLLTFPPYAANAGIATAGREEELRRIYCGSEEESAAAMQRLGADYVISGYGAPGCSFAYERSARFGLVFQSGDVRIYRFLG